MLIDPAHGGQAKFSNDDYVEGAPEFVAEVSSSSVSMDMNTKLRMYGRGGVKEYLVWRVADRAIDWFALRGSTYEPLVAQAEGIIRSEVFPGLWLDTAAMIEMNLTRVLSALRQGIESKEHAAFVKLLGSHARGT
jgi:Uma2 family endonuclease